jgi:hypothetical protein
MKRNKSHTDKLKLKNLHIFQFLNSCWCAWISYPEPAGQINSSTRMWLGIRMYIIPCVAVLFVLFLLVMCIGLIYKYLRSRTLDLQDSQIWASQVGQSQVQPAAWKALRSIPGRGNMEQSTFGKRPGWTHSQQHQLHLSRFKYVRINKLWLIGEQRNNILRMCACK